MAQKYNLIYDVENVKSICPHCYQPEHNKRGKQNSCPLTAVKQALDGGSDTSVTDNTTSTSKSTDKTIIAAVQSLPAKLCLRNTEKGTSVFSFNHIRKNSVFGPVKGLLVRDAKSSIPEGDTHRCVWPTQHQRAELENVTRDSYVITGDPSQSNWCHYLHASMEDSNLVAVCIKGQVYLVTTRSVPSGEEMTYSAPYLLDMSSSKYHSLQLQIQTACFICDKSFQDPVYLHKHLYISHPGRLYKKRHSCPKCKKIFITKKELDSHVGMIHSEEDVFKCVQCSKKFGNSKSLRLHQWWNHSKSAECKKKCHDCGKGFFRFAALRRHMQLKHNSDPLLSCSICERSFRDRGVLKRHLGTHSDTTTTTCEKCGKSFRDETNLKVHMLSHSGIKPFACDQPNCQSGFTTKQSLQHHYRKVHEFTSENMPTISRVIPFTFKAHSEIENIEDLSGEIHPKMITKNAVKNKKSGVGTRVKNEDSQDLPPIKRSLRKGKARKNLPLIHKQDCVDVKTKEHDVGKANSESVSQDDGRGKSRREHKKMKLLSDGNKRNKVEHSSIKKPKRVKPYQKLIRDHQKCEKETIMEPANEFQHKPHSIIGFPSQTSAEVSISNVDLDLPLTYTSSSIGYTVMAPPPEAHHRNRPFQMPSFEETFKPRHKDNLVAVTSEDSALEPPRFLSSSLPVPAPLASLDLRRTTQGTAAVQSMHMPLMSLVVQPPLSHSSSSMLPSAAAALGLQPATLGAKSHTSTVTSFGLQPPILGAKTHTSTATNFGLQPDLGGKTHTSSVTGFGLQPTDLVAKTHTSTATGLGLGARTHPMHTFHQEKQDKVNTLDDHIANVRQHMDMLSSTAVPSGGENVNLTVNSQPPEMTHQIPVTFESGVQFYSFSVDSLAQMSKALGLK